jgi:transcriptional regulator with XRE-family HTH domain
MKPEEFRATRLAAGMTQAELAGYLGVSGWRKRRQGEP